jgi:hypothetical protein
MANRRRTILMSPERSRQIALAAAYLDTSGEKFIQDAITDALCAMAKYACGFVSVTGE